MKIKLDENLPSRLGATSKECYKIDDPPQPRRGQYSVRINDQFRLSQAELAIKLGVSYPRINELIHGKRGITPDTALRLEQLFGMEAQFWLNLQLAWDLYHLTHSAAAKRIRRIKRLPSLEAPTVR